MKTTRWIHSTIMALTLAMSGCSKQSSVDTALFEKTFKAAEATVQTSADKVVIAIKSGNHSGALAELKNLAKHAELTSEQHRAVKDVMAQLEKLITAPSANAARGPGKRVKDIPKTLPA